MEEKLQSEVQAHVAKRGRRKGVKRVISTAQAIAVTPAVGSPVDTPVENLPPMFDTIDDPDVLAERFDYTGGATLNLEVHGYSEEWLQKWHPHWARDYGGNIQNMMYSLGYYWVTTDELPNLRMNNKSIAPASGGKRDNRIMYMDRSGDILYLMKCPKRLFEKRQQDDQNESIRRMDYIQQRKSPEIPGGLSQANSYSPNLTESDAYRFEEKLVRS